MSHIFKKKALTAVVGTVVASFALSGCTTYNQTRESAKNERDFTNASAKDNFSKLSKPKMKPTVEVLDSFYIADGTKPVKYAEPLPEMNIHISSKSSMTMNQILERARAETGIPMRLVAELDDDDDDDIEFDELSQLPVMPLNIDDGYVVNHNGSLDSFLDKIAAQFDLSWKYENSQVVFYRYLTKTFEVNALPGETSVSANLSGGSGSFGDSDSDSSSSGGSNETTLSSSTSVWLAFEENIPTMLSEDGKMVISEATGKIIVKDKPHIVNEIERYIERENKDMRKQVMVNVKVLSVSKNRDAGANIDWNVVYDEMSSKANYALTGNGLNLNGGAAVLSGGVTDGNFAGSDVAFEVIDDNTDSTLMTNVFLSTINGQPAPLQVVQKKAYIKSAGSTTTETSTTTTIEQGTVDTGFSLSILPRIMKDDKILLQYSINISELVALDSVTSGNQTVQTPEINTRDFLQKISIKSGDTLIISGFERAESSYEKSIGGAVDGVSNDTIVIIITPVIIDR